MMKIITGQVRKSCPPDERFAELSIDRLLGSESGGAELLPLAKTISQFGFIEPCAVRKKGEGFEIVCGKERVMAARLAGLRTVPCFITELSDSGAAAASLASMIHTHSPDPFRTAELIAAFCTGFRFTEQQAAVILGLPRKTVSAKLRLMRLTGEQRQLMSSNRMTEDHAAIILTLPAAERTRFIGRAAEKKMSPDELARYIADVRREEKTLRSYRRRSRALSDTHLFFNTIEKAVRILRLAGVGIVTEKLSREGFTEYIIKIPDKDCAKN